MKHYMWSGTAVENNPCPSGFLNTYCSRMEQERRTWSSMMKWCLCITTVLAHGGYRGRKLWFAQW
ncbi:MAG: hypothetical protein IPO48_11635 [Saprospiraceae bacterium]|nr:hypothetical protein [Saprospiraceae bacterium]